VRFKASPARKLDARSRTISFELSSNSPFTAPARAAGAIGERIKNPLDAKIGDVRFASSRVEVFAAETGFLARILDGSSRGGPWLAFFFLCRERTLADIRLNGFVGAGRLTGRRRGCRERRGAAGGGDASFWRAGSSKVRGLKWGFARGRA